MIFLPTAPLHKRVSRHPLQKQCNKGFSHNSLSQGRLLSAYKKIKLFYVLLYAIQSRLVKLIPCSLNSAVDVTLHRISLETILNIHILNNFLVLHLLQILKEECSLYTTCTQETDIGLNRGRKSSVFYIEA